MYFFRGAISHFSELPYRTFQNYDIALFRTPISHVSELPYRTFQNSHIALFRTTISHFWASYRVFGLSAVSAEGGVWEKTESQSAGHQVRSLAGHPPEFMSFLQTQL